MDIIKKRINLNDFPKTDGGYAGGVVLDERFTEFLPCHEESGVTVVMAGTLTHYCGWLTNFVISSEYATMGLRGDKVVVRKENANMEDVADAFDFFSGCTAVFPSEEEAKDSVDVGCGDKVCINPDCDVFLKMFGDIYNAQMFLSEDICNMTGTTEAVVEIPVLITETVKDLGMYELYDEESAGFDPDDTRIGIEEWEDDDIVSGDTTFVESQLKTLTREKRSYDNEGNELPFTEVDGVLELPYKIGNPCDIMYEDGVFTYNVLKSVTYYYMDGVIDDGSANKCHYDGSMPTEGIIEFVYEVGVLTNGETTEPGIEYVERHYYTVEEYNGMQYISVQKDTIDKPGNALPDAQYARIDAEAEGETLYEDNHMIKDDAFLNVHDAKADLGDVYVDRGDSASYEALNVMGEVNTIEDIEKYRDDWFRIKGKND